MQIPLLQAEYFKTKVEPEIEKYAPLFEKFLLENGNNGLLLRDQVSGLLRLFKAAWCKPSSTSLAPPCFPSVALF